MNLTKIVFIGSTDEYTAVRHIFEEQSASAAVDDHSSAGDARTSAINGHAANHQPGSETSEYDDIVAVLRHVTLSPQQEQLLNELYNRGDDYISRNELAATLRLTLAQFNGFTGTLGRRIKGTPGVGFDMRRSSPLSLLIDTRVIQGELHYRLQPEARRALADEGLVPPSTDDTKR